MAAGATCLPTSRAESPCRFPALPARGVRVPRFGRSAGCVVSLFLPVFSVLTYYTVHVCSLHYISLRVGADSPEGVAEKEGKDWQLVPGGKSEVKRRVFSLQPGRSK